MAAQPTTPPSRQSTRKFWWPFRPSSGSAASVRSRVIPAQSAASALRMLNGSLMAKLSYAASASGGRAARGRAAGRWLCRLLRQVILEHHEDFPFVPVGITRPGFILHGIAAFGLHFVARVQPCPSPTLAHGQHFFGGANLNAEMGERARPARVRFLRSQFV